MNQKTEELLAEMRRGIDQVDRELLRALQKRSSIVRKIAHLKVKNNLPILQKKRSEQIQNDRRKLGQKLGLSKSYIDKLFRLVMSESISDQKLVAQKKRIQSTNKRMSQRMSQRMRKK
jgi:chorismate mutase